MAEFLGRLGATLIGWGVRLSQQHQEAAATALEAQQQALVKRQAALDAHLKALRQP